MVKIYATEINFKSHGPRVVLAGTRNLYVQILFFEKILSITQFYFRQQKILLTTRVQGYQNTGVTFLFSITLSFYQFYQQQQEKSFGVQAVTEKLRKHLITVEQEKSYYICCLSSLNQGSQNLCRYQGYRNGFLLEVVNNEAFEMVERRCQAVSFFFNPIPIGLGHVTLI